MCDYIKEAYPTPNKDSRGANGQEVNNAEIHIGSLHKSKRRPAKSKNIKTVNEEAEDLKSNLYTDEDLVVSTRYTKSRFYGELTDSLIRNHPDDIEISTAPDSMGIKILNFMSSISSQSRKDIEQQILNKSDGFTDKEFGEPALHDLFQNFFKIKRIKNRYSSQLITNLYSEYKIIGDFSIGFAKHFEQLLKTNNFDYRPLISSQEAIDKLISDSSEGLSPPSFLSGPDISRWFQDKIPWVKGTFGMTLAAHTINRWDIYLSNFRIKNVGNKRQCEYIITYYFYDHFGLDIDDLAEFSVKALNGIESWSSDFEIFMYWFYLQYFKKSNPFVLELKHQYGGQFFY